VAKERDTSLDVVRGLAVLIMLPANAAPLLAEPHPFAFRLVGSFAAPLFIFLSGLMAGMSAGRGRRATYLWQRALWVLCFAAVVDVGIWRIVPFTTMDVLYLVAVCMLVLGALRRLPAWALVALAGLVFALTPLLQSWLGYSAAPLEIGLSGAIQMAPEQPVSVLQHWLVDGWFPLCPWLGFGLLGGAVGRARLGRATPTGLPRAWSLSLSAALVLLGSGLWWRFPGAALTREGYSELFYPPMPGFLLVAVGAIGLLLEAASAWTRSRAFAPLRALGEASMACYVGHLVLLAYLLPALFEALDGITFAGVVFGLEAVIIGLGFALRPLRRALRSPPLPVKMLVGG
jgi:uncharacterized membrane protein